ncbi:hypothetical protein [Actinomadura miaoliensis]|uniref:C2H2-type domain-containing protein n=1 Tax=Actinomadura miaoliensis TaxID=430685 RepID=A0ABP7UV59_9ACTN
MFDQQEEGPEFGYAVDALWSARDWEVEQVRVVLCAAGCAEFPARAGFSVESHDPLTVGICDDFTDPARPVAARARAAQVLTEAGYRIEPHPYDEELPAVRPPAGQTPAPPARGERGRHCVECGQPLTPVEAAASRAHRWHGRCADCRAEQLARSAEAADQD